MPYDLTPHLRPTDSALVIFECQEGVIGETSHLPALAASAREVGLVENTRSLLDAARASRVNVLYCKVEKRRDGLARSASTPLEIRLQARADASAGSTPGPDMGEIVGELAPGPGEAVVAREHGMTGFYESGLDACLRGARVRTLVLCGVSLNIGILGTAIEAVNRGYTVVIPKDCVAADPPEYADAVLRYSIRNIAFLTTRSDVEAVWMSPR